MRSLSGLHAEASDSPSQADTPATALACPASTRLALYLPLATFTTVLVIVVPAALAATLGPHGGPLSMAASTGLAIALSLAFASAESALWKRRRQARDVVFAELMLWGWLRRCWNERGLAHARDLYHSAAKAGPTVDIALLRRLSSALEARDAYTHGHDRRVARHAGRIARAMRVPAVEAAKIRTAAAVHDVGKLHTPRAILNNPGRLSDAEFAVLKRHAADGAAMLAAVGDPDITAMVRHHHERVDGGGYPDGLSGSDIPLGARIIAVADTFDAITSNRAYRSAATQKKALDILSTEAGAQLDAAAVAAFLSCYSARRSVAWCELAAALPMRLIEGLRAASSTLAVIPNGGSLLPALGAAGVLAFSGAPRRDTLATRPQVRSLAVAQSPQLGTRALSIAGTRSADSGLARAMRRASPHTVRGRTAPPAANVPGAPEVPSTDDVSPTIAVNTGTSEPVAQAAEAHGAESAPNPDPPTSAPVSEAPVATPIPVPRVTAAAPPSVTVAVPSVTVPAISIPPVTPVSVTTPAVTIPGVTILGLSTPRIVAPSGTVSLGASQT
jgi:HD-GYP domain-containing protein (c-di-GMP phosphodiesterase class II)